MEHRLTSPPLFNVPLLSKGIRLEKEGNWEDVQVDILNGVLTIRTLNVRKWKALGHALLLRLRLQLVVVVDVHSDVLVVRSGVGLDDVHGFRAESKKVVVKEAEVGYEASGENEDERGRTRRDNDGGG